MKRNESIALWSNLLGSGVQTGLGMWQGKKLQEEEEKLRKTYLENQARLTALKERYINSLLDKEREAGNTGMGLDVFDEGGRYDPNERFINTRESRIPPLRRGMINPSGLLDDDTEPAGWDTHGTGREPYMRGFSNRKF